MVPPFDPDPTLIALANPTRRAILQRLSAGEARVTDLAEPFDMSFEAVSKHLRVLEGVRLVRRRRAGREHYFVLDARPLERIADWIATQREAWTSRLAALDRMLRAEDAADGRAGKASPRSAGASTARTRIPSTPRKRSR